MYLKLLTDDEKMGFLILAKAAAQANGELASEEKELLLAYCNEMELDPRLIETMPDASIEKIAEGFKEIDKQHKSIVLFELLGMMYADGSYDEDEKSFVFMFGEAIGFEKEAIERFQNVMDRYVKTVIEVSELVLKS